MSIKGLVRNLNKSLSERKGGFDFGIVKPSFADSWGVGDVPAWIPSGITLLDAKQGGGLPLGRISEVFSEHESEGKTSIALHYVAQVQRAGGVAVWLESEAALDKPRAQRMGVDLSTLIFWSPPTVEDAFVYIDTVLNNIASDKSLKDVPVLIVWDTIAMAMTRAEKNGDALGEGLTVKNRVVSAALRKYVTEFFKFKAHLLLVNQSYTIINRSNPYAPQFETPGGKAMKYACTTRLRCKRVGYVGDTRDLGPKDQRTGIKVRITAVKNKLALPFQDAELVLFGARGYNDIVSMAEFFLENKVHDMLSYRGGWYTLPDGTKSTWADIEEKVSSREGILRQWKSKVWEILPLGSDRIMGDDGWVVRKQGTELVETSGEGEETGGEQQPGQT